jgi:hypothetical protein
VARLAAAAVTHTEIAARTGYSINRVNSLLSDPSMQELVATYRAKLDEHWLGATDALGDLITTATFKAYRELNDRLDDDSSALTTRELVSIASDGADRIGYGKRSTNVNLNVDFAAKLEAAIARKNFKVISNDAA